MGRQEKNPGKKRGGGERKKNGFCRRVNDHKKQVTGVSGYGKKKPERRMD